MTLRAVVYDFDGVILESADVKTDAFVELYAHHGADVCEQVRAHHLANLGISRFKKFEWIAANVLGAPIDDAQSKALGEQFSALALEKVLAAPFVPGAMSALAALTGRLPQYVASGTPNDELLMIVARRGLEVHFAEVHGTPREKPVILADLMSRGGWAPDEILFIGDGMSDYKAAKAAGVQFLARDTPALHDEWVKLGCKRAPDLTTLVELVDGW